MHSKRYVIALIALIVALGGLLMGFDASVISGVVGFIEPEFQLTKLELGWSVASLTLSATLAMMFAGPLSDKIGRRAVLRIAAILYAISALGSALAPDFFWLVVARMIGGFGVGASLILAPMYIAEMSPPELRGRLVSFNQLNIVIGISLAFFTNYLILQYAKETSGWVTSLGLSGNEWRWMFGLETVPAMLYFIGLFFVPKSPRWLILQGKEEEARKIMCRLTSEQEADHVLEEMKNQDSDQGEAKGKLKDLLHPSLRLVLTIGIVVAVLQQITGINSVFFYAPMIFEQSGIGTDASFIQAIMVGITNLVFTVLALLFIDRLGRKPLLVFGVSGMAISLFLLAYGFNISTYTLTAESIDGLSEGINKGQLAEMVDVTYDSDVEFNAALVESLGKEAAGEYKSQIITAAISTNPIMILIGILGFVASFAISIGPVMWVLFSELFPNAIRGIAISFVGLINSAISFVVQWVFPWELQTLGNAMTFAIYGIFAAAGLIFIIRIVPETKGKSLEELEEKLVGAE